MNPILTDLDSPLVFRTTNAEVYKPSLASGSLWLRSDHYYRELEDAARNDTLEGFNGAQGGIPMHFPPMFDGIALTIVGTGSIGQMIVPHYLACFHSTSITEEQRQQFGGHTFGVRNFARLAAEVMYRSSLQVPVSGYRFGQVSYQHSALARQMHPISGAAIRISGKPPTHLNPINTDVLRKRPAKPFIDQDEWRIAIFTSGYLNNDPNAPLCVHVDPSHFYPYLSPAQPSQPE
jgi:hypothetical protein